MFKTINSQNIEEIIKTLRTRSERVEINFQNEYKDSPILNIALKKIHDVYAIEIDVTKNADLSSLGKMSGECFVKFEKCPRVTYFSYKIFKANPKFQVGVRISDEKDSIQNLGKIIEVAELLDKLDPAFVTLMTQIINIETRYRSDTRITERFNDLIPEKSAFKEWLSAKESRENKKMEAYRKKVDELGFFSSKLEDVPACLRSTDSYARVLAEHESERISSLSLKDVSKPISH